MDSELQALEERVRNAADLAKRLRAENVDLRQKAAALESENKRLAERIESAAQRIEALAKRIPE